jgi:hypothetical protein
MLKGEELVQKRALLLCYLYEQGAIAPNSAIDAADLQKAIGVNDRDLESLYQNLSQAELVQAPGRIPVFGGYTGEFKISLTDNGLKEAASIAHAIQKSAEQAAKGPMGFQLPRKNK